LERGGILCLSPFSRGRLRGGLINKINKISVKGKISIKSKISVKVK